MADLTKRYGCRTNGVEDIKKHKWFADLDWEVLLARGLAGPIVPEVKGADDTSNFDPCVGWWWWWWWWWRGWGGGGLTYPASQPRPDVLLPPTATSTTRLAAITSTIVAVSSAPTAVLA